MINSQIGMLVTDNERPQIRVTRPQIGFALFGPYATLAAGNHQVDFDIVLDSNAGLSDGDIVCKLDVCCGLGTELLVRQDVTAEQLRLAELTKFTLTFSVESETIHLEFRVWSMGRADFTVAEERSVTTTYLASERGNAAQATGFCKTFAEDLRKLRVQGANIVERWDSALISLGGINIIARHQEDFQLIAEVITYNIYKIIPVRDAIAVDVGMNIGVASLYLAKEKWARKVYSFEPFYTPFSRSGEVFDCNPDVKDKIVARNVGLSDKNERLHVHYNSESTIATGIKGVASGPIQELEILDAGQVFEDICAEAQEKNIGVIVKLDCEGSEFPIMQRLVEKNLLRKIDAFMIEWHKVWSPDVTINNLLDPLRANGFVIFDRTVEADLYAGMLFAVKVQS